MTAAPVRYRQHQPPTAGSPCELCEARPGRPVVDHCHEHQWVRGVLCARCNSAMSYIDQRIPPTAALAFGVTLDTLISFAARCPDCPPVDVAEFSLAARWSRGRHVTATSPMSADAGDMGVQTAREKFRTVVDDAQIHRKPTIITRHGLTAAVVIPPEWWEELLRHREAGEHGDSTSSR